MKWFQHQAKAHRDGRMRKLLMRHGAAGYGLYWYCIENICDQVDPRIDFTLDLDSEVLAHDLKLDSRLVEDIMAYLVELGLVQNNAGRISCPTLAKNLGDNLTRNQHLKRIISQSKLTLSETVSDCLDLSLLEERRGEERRVNKGKPRVMKKPTKEELADYIHSGGYRVNPDYFFDYQEARGWKLKGGQAMKDWKATVRNWDRMERDRNPEPKRDDIV